jgi:hypothetical protein
MSLGLSTSPGQLNSQVGSLAVQLRDLMENIGDFAQWFSSLTLADVETEFGLSSTDAATMQTLVAYFSNVYGVYNGTIQQGGSGGTGAILFDFNDALSVLWGGQ